MQSNEPLTNLLYITSRICGDNVSLEAGRVRGRLPSGQYLIELSHPSMPTGTKFCRRSEGYLIGALLFDREADWRKAFTDMNAEEGASDGR